MLWWVAGGALVGLLLIVAYPVIQGGRGAQDPVGGTPAASGGMPGSGPSSLDLTTMTPREAADRLYDRVMMAVEAGDSVQAVGFLPMAISAYEIAEPLNADGRFHVATLKQTQGDFEGAMASALAGLEDNPDHLLNLVAAARAAHAMGDDVTAGEHYTQVLDAWQVEMGKGLEEYELHSRMLPDLRSEAEAFLER
jgi:tetratricopeptide (TPR) repeat protein